MSHREGALGEQGAHVALAAEARQAQALRGLLHDVPHRPKQRRLWAALRGLRSTAGTSHSRPFNKNEKQSSESLSLGALHMFLDMILSRVVCLDPGLSIRPETHLSAL